MKQLMLKTMKILFHAQKAVCHASFIRKWKWLTQNTVAPKAFQNNQQKKRPEPHTKVKFSNVFIYSYPIKPKNLHNWNTNLCHVNCINIYHVLHIIKANIILFARDTTTQRILRMVASGSKGNHHDIGTFSTTCELK